MRRVEIVNHGIAGRLKRQNARSTRPVCGPIVRSRAARITGPHEIGPVSHHPVREMLLRWGLPAALVLNSEKILQFTGMIRADVEVVRNLKVSGNRRIPIVKLINERFA